MTTYTVRRVDADTPGYDGPAWVLETARGEWRADLTISTYGGTLNEVRLALRSAGVHASSLTPTGGNVEGPTNPPERTTRSLEWTVTA